MGSVEPGYWIEQGVFSDLDCDDIIAGISGGTSKRGRAGARHLMWNPTVAAMTMDRRLLAIARTSLGAQAIPFRATLFEKSRHANWLVAWHQDRALPITSFFDAPGWGPWSEKGGIAYALAPVWALSRILALRVHLDASTNENGPLRLIPGSHAAGILTDREVIEYARTHDHVNCLVQRGGVLAMRPLLIHSSSKASSSEARIAHPRRVLHVEYADALDLQPGIRLAVA